MGRIAAAWAALRKPNGSGASPSGGRRYITARTGLGTIADLISVAVAIASLVGLVRGAPLPQAVLAFALAGLAVAFMLLSFQLQRQQAARLTDEAGKSRHAASWQEVAASAAALRDGTAALNVGEHPSTFSQHAGLAVTHMASAMSQATGASCRVIVKVVYAPGGRDDVAVRTLVRSDVDSTKVVRTPNSSIDWVRENTDFDEIFYHDADYFLSNDLSQEGGYKNSHIDTALIAKSGWPYKATIVWPVFGPDGAGGIEISAFLCVDTKSADVFIEDLDVVVGKTLAPLWYVALQRFDEATELNGA